MTADISKTLAAHGLFVMGRTDDLLLVGAGSEMWPIFIKSTEYSDGLADPLDRWSKRILNEVAAANGWETVFPSDGPPCAPFIAWAKQTGQFWDSPVGMLVHNVAGLMISIRGAFVLSSKEVAEPLQSPCKSCATTPCISACPVDALGAERGYEVDACHAYLDTDGGRDCLANGCKARRVCPISQSFGRDPEQSAFHMRAFHP